MQRSPGLAPCWEDVQEHPGPWQMGWESHRHVSEEDLSWKWVLPSQLLQLMPRGPERNHPVGFFVLSRPTKSCNVIKRSFYAPRTGLFAMP
jgi:hypothetical protein